MKIDLTNYGARTFTGRKNGAAARERYGLDERTVDDASEIIVSIPEDTVALTSSFLLGMFADAIRHEGSRDAFLRKFRFEPLPARFREDIERTIERALRKKVSMGELLGHQ